MSHDVLGNSPEMYLCPVCDRAFEVLMDEDKYVEQGGYAPQTAAGVQPCEECMDGMRVHLEVCGVDPDEVEENLDDLWDCDHETILYARLVITGKEEG